MELFINNHSLLRCLFIPLAVILTSFYFFPFEFTFLLGFNTKMIMAGLGCFLMLFQLAKKRSFEMQHDLLRVFCCAIIVSVIGLLSVLYNDTVDFTYSTYFVSMLVWLSAANVVVSFIRLIHGYVSVSLVCKYLIVVCFLQCALALLIDSYESFRDIVNSYIANFSSSVSTGKSLDEAGRLYGIGAALDIAGSRFSAVLIMIGYSIMLPNVKIKQVIYLLLSFVFIFIIGSAISRTTIVGFFLAILCCIVVKKSSNMKALKSNNANGHHIWIYMLCLLLVSALIIVYLYNTNLNFHKSFRFAFEGFFNLIEAGTLRTGSTDTLKSMYIFPEEIKTWIIGDGYFADPIKKDPYYVGETISAFYKGVDVGYLRFIYYFGVCGLIAFIIYFLKVTGTCMSRFPAYHIMFLFILGVNLFVWLKVATDIFLVFAPFLCISKEENNAYMERIVLQEQTG